MISDGAEAFGLVFVFVYFPEEVFFWEEAIFEFEHVVHIGVPRIGKDWPGFVFVGDGVDPGVVACGGVPFFGAVGEGVPGGPVVVGDFGPVGGEEGEFLLGEGFGAEDFEVGE